MRFQTSKETKLKKSISEILDEVSKAKGSKKNELLKQHDSVPLRTILKFAYDERIEFLLPDSAPPYNPSQSFEGQGMLYSEARRLRIFVKGGGYDQLNQVKREALFIELLESIDKDDAQVVIDMLVKRKFKGLTKKVVEETFPEMFV